MPLRRALIIATVLATALTGAPTRADVPVKPLQSLPALKGLDERWTAMMDLFDTPGLAVAVVKDGVIYTTGYGVRSADSDAPVTPETMFYIASITKTYTASALVALEGDGRLTLDDPVKKYAPRFDLKDSELASRITIRDLLCHRYGIGGGPVVLLDAYSGEITEDRFWYWISRGEVAGKVDYTNPDFTIAGRVVEGAAGKPWRDYLQERIFTPAGMTRTTGYASVMYGDPNSATPLQRTTDGKSWEPVTQRKTDRTMHAAGGLGTTAIDGARWLMLHLNNGEIDGKRILPAKGVAAMRSPESTFEKPRGTIRIETAFGLAWFIGTMNDHPLIAHGGGYTGAAAYMAMLPEDNAAIVILINAGGPARGFMDIVAVDLMERITGAKAAWDVYESYSERIRKMKAEGKVARDDENPGAISASLLSRPTGQYTGWFRNEHLGTLIITRSADGLAVSLGDAPLEVSTDPATPDHFTLVGMGDEGSNCEFLIEPGGAINTIRLSRADFGQFDFTR